MADWTSSSLVWPRGVGRSVSPILGRSGPKVKKGVAEVLKAIDLLEAVTSSPVSDLVLTYGDPADARQTGDAGAAVWFKWEDIQRCVPCDLYGSPGANLSAVAQLVRGCVAEHSRGSLAAVGHALASYSVRTTLPSVASEDHHWSEALGIGRDATPAEITAGFRRRAHAVHPDKGGTREQWDTVVDALRQARLENAHLDYVQLSQAVADGDQEQVDWARMFPDAPSGDESES